MKRKELSPIEELHDYKDDMEGFKLAETVMHNVEQTPSRYLISYISGRLKEVSYFEKLSREIDAPSQEMKDFSQKLTKTAQTLRDQQIILTKQTLDSFSSASDFSTKKLILNEDKIKKDWEELGRCEKQLQDQLTEAELSDEEKRKCTDILSDIQEIKKTKTAKILTGEGLSRKEQKEVAEDVEKYLANIKLKSNRIYDFIDAQSDKSIYLDEKIKAHFGSKADREKDIKDSLIQTQKYKAKLEKLDSSQGAGNYMSKTSKVLRDIRDTEKKLKRYQKTLAGTKLSGREKLAEIVETLKSKVFSGKPKLGLKDKIMAKFRRKPREKDGGRRLM